MSEDDVHELSRLRRERQKLLLQQKLQEFANVCNRIGEILSRLGRFDEALEEHLAEEAACVNVNDELGLAIADRKIGECHLELERYDLALKYQQKHLEIATRLDNVVEQQRALATIGRTYLCQAEASSATNCPQDAMKALSNAENSFLKSLDLCSRLQCAVESRENAQMQARLFLNLGLVWDQRGDLESCVQFVQKAIAINREKNLAEDLLRCHHILSLAYRRRSQLGNALAHVRQAIKVLDKVASVTEERELLTLQGHILLLSSEFQDARAVLRKTQKMALSADGTQMNEARRLWRIASKLCSTEEKLLQLPDDDTESQVKLYEKMGDLCCQVQSYKKGLFYYYKMLDFSEKLGRGGRDLAAVYLSLAQTYADIRQYDRASHYYSLELKCWAGNLEESCKTLLNIAECDEFVGKDYESLEQLYERAFAFAREVENVGLQRRCLHSLSVVQATFGVAEKQAATVQKLELLADGDFSDSETAEGTVTDSSTSSDSEDAATTDDDDESLEERMLQHRRSTRKRKRFQANEKGEMPLHRACIDGDIELVKELLEQGHPVNVRDYSGWLPLHEAANHDHADIVRVLLDHGAWINDRGGRYCDGVTPIHDAASNGHLEVIDVLVERGASVLVKTNSGETVVSCLASWRKRAAKENTDPDIIAQGGDMEVRLRHLMKEAGERLQGSRRIKDVMVARTETDVSPTACQALIREGESNADEIDDWLVEDVSTARLCRKRRRANDSPVRAAHPVSSSKLQQRRRRRVVHRAAVVRRQTRTADFSLVATPYASDADDSMDCDDVVSTDEPVIDESSSRSMSPPIIGSSKGEPPSTVVKQDNVMAQSLLRIKIKILDKLLLIPVPCGETVLWLASEAARRYYLMHGLRPILTLSTKDGALLAAVDVVSHVISPEEEVVGVVESWDLPPLTERYTEACVSLSETLCDNILEVFRQAKGTVCLSNLRLNAGNIRPIFHALQCQYSLTELILAGNRFGNDGLQPLAQLVVHLPSLRLLDLSCNDLTDDGLSHLAGVVSSHTVLQNLEVLKLGFNPVLERTSAHLSIVLRHLQSLKELHLPSCCTGASRESPDVVKTISHAAHHLQHLDLSYCRLSASTHLADLGNALVARPLQTLELSGVVACGDDAMAITKVAVQLLDHEGCQLKSLALSHSFLDDECAWLIISSIVGQRERCLNVLKITFNPAISKKIISELTSQRVLPQNVMIQF